MLLHNTKEWDDDAYRFIYSNKPNVFKESCTTSSNAKENNMTENIERTCYTCVGAEVRKDVLRPGGRASRMKET